MIKELIAKFKDWNIIKGTIYHYTAYFTTTDEADHIYTKYKYGAEDQITCSIPEYIMMDIKSKGYIEDDNSVMYPLENVVSISWVCDDKVDNIPLERYKVFYTKEGK